ncbi:MAG TPA: cytochrome c3 family protein [Bryobacteraceae bacterium]|nr:cytochrome c3 family protein [Bryobacteraceae bacterium]
MGNSIAAPKLQGPGHVMHDPSGASIAIEERDGRMIHSVTQGAFTAEHAVDYQIGANLLGYSYIVRIGDYYFQSPASWYKHNGWDISPGYQYMKAIEFDRPINEACLYCHTNATQFSGPDGRRVASATLEPISCERCHGPSREHLRRPGPGTIVNPAKLAGRARSSVCEQCHLEGDARVLNPGKTLSDFHAGQRLENVLTVYVANRQETGANVVNHVEQLAVSRCARESGGKMWCGTCHDPHGEPVDRKAQMRGICRSCHPSLSREVHRGDELDCVSCHMPHSPASDIQHSAITDHRILRRPLALQQPSEAAIEHLEAWADPPAEVRQRNLGLAELLVSILKHVPQLAAPGLSLLENLGPGSAANDPLVLEALGSARVNRGDLREGIGFHEQAAVKQPGSADYAYNLAVDLRAAGDIEGAQREYKRAIANDPSLSRAYLDLAGTYYYQRRDTDALAVLNLYLKFNPESIAFRAQRAGLLAQH